MDIFIFSDFRGNSDLDTGEQRFSEHKGRRLEVVSMDKGEKEGTHWIVKAASVCLWIIFAVNIYMIFNQTNLSFHNNISLSFYFILISFITIFLLSLLVWIPIQSKILIFIVQFSPLLPAIVFIKYPSLILFSFYNFFMRPNIIFWYIFSGGPLGFLFTWIGILVGIISMGILIINAWYPIRSKSKEVKV